MTQKTIWPITELPRERLKQSGANALSDIELIALILGTGNRNEHVMDTARRLLVEAGGLNRLLEQGLAGLEKTPGLGKVKAARLVAALELGIRLVEIRAGKQSELSFHHSYDFFNVFHPRLNRLKQEVFLVVGLNHKNQIISESTVAIGSISECHVEPREVFRPLILDAASRAVLIHNHPSGDPSPSTEDVSVTKRLIKTGELVGIPVLDHIIIGQSSHTSLRDLGLIMEFDSVG